MPQETPPGPPTSPLETGVERVLTREEVLLEIGKYIENPEVTKELKDEKGPYFIRAEAPGKEDGEVIECVYFRKGNYPEMSPQGTTIQVSYLKGGETGWGETKADWDPKTGKWKQV